MLGYLESFIISLVIYLIIYKIYLKKKDKRYIIKFTLMYIYLFLVLCVTILPIDFTLDLKWKYHDSIDFNYIYLKPFNDLIMRRAGAKVQIILNIIMTIPFGFLYTSIKKNTNIVNVTISTFILSLIIESIQLVMTIFLLYHRTCDVTDLITNVIGGIIGYSLYRIIKLINKRIQI